MRSASTASDLVVDALATHRLATLVVDDKAGNPIRCAVIQIGQEIGRGEEAEYLVGCYWCSSMWLALGVVAARRFTPRLWSPVGRLLAFSTVAGAGGTVMKLTRSLTRYLDDAPAPG